MKAWLGLGSNLQQPVAQLRQAIVRLGEADGLAVLRTSSLYRTPPWGDDQQDDFINVVVEIETSLEPIPLLRAIQSIENVMGRQRSGRRWGPRLIDIDLLLYGNQQYHSTDLDVPHPHMHQRAFVLIPLSELDAGLEIPGHGTVSELLQGVDGKGICQLDDSCQD